MRWPPSARMLLLLRIVLLTVPLLVPLPASLPSKCARDGAARRVGHLKSVELVRCGKSSWLIGRPAVCHIRRGFVIAAGAAKVHHRVRSFLHNRRC